VRVEILYFASAREATGLSSETLEAKDGATVADVRALVAERHPSLASAWPHVRLAVGTRFAADGDRVAEGDRVALIPPVGGG
jgi:molybdopterin synthase catalytic subunit